MQVRIPTPSCVEYLGRVDRDAHVRAARRRQALDALAFEQDREVMLVEQLEDIMAEVEGVRLDAGLFAEMSPDHAKLVRAALGVDPAAEADDGEAGVPHELGAAEEEPDDAVEPDDVEPEIVRLQDEIEAARRVQAALRQYLELLSGRPVT